MRKYIPTLSPKLFIVKHFNFDHLFGRKTIMPSWIKYYQGQEVFISCREIWFTEKTQSYLKTDNEMNFNPRVLGILFLLFWEKGLKKKDKIWLLAKTDILEADI